MGESGSQATNGAESGKRGAAEPDGGEKAILPLNGGHQSRNEGVDEPFPFPPCWSPRLNADGDQVLRA